MNIWDIVHCYRHLASNRPHTLGSKPRLPYTSMLSQEQAYPNVQILLRWEASLTNCVEWKYCTLCQGRLTETNCLPSHASCIRSPCTSHRTSAGMEAWRSLSLFDSKLDTIYKRTAFRKQFKKEQSTIGEIRYHKKTWLERSTMFSPRMLVTF
jgi:hypothetical protein